MPRSHKSLPRLYVSADLEIGGGLHLDKDQSNYLAAVLRKKRDDEVVVFNGRHGAWLARITADSKKNVVLALVEQIAVQPAPTDLWYGFAPLKSARLDYVIQKATEMGVSTIQPVTTQYTQLHRLNMDKVLANAIEAAEQCEVLTVPAIAPETTLEKLLADWSRVHGARKLIFADEGEGASSPLEKLLAIKDQPIGLLIGPEGGFSDEERRKLRAQPYVIPISLGPRILRADTAAVAAMAVIQASIGDWRY
jgi:16S rRNA (uracil1498-N3)-methyltransferase